MPELTRVDAPGVAPTFSTHAVRHGELAYVSGCMALDHAGELAADDFETQMRVTLGNLGAVLEAAGAGFGDVLKTTVFVTEIEQRPTVRAVREEFFGGVKTASSLVEVPRLAVPGAKVAIDAIAVVTDDGHGSAERKEIKAPELEPQFSADAVRYGDLVFVTGCVSTNVEGEIVGEGDLEAQTRGMLDNLRSVLQAAGAELRDVLKTTVFMLDVGGRDLTYKVRDEYFGSAPPASTMIEVSALGRPDYLIEIDAIAAAPERA
ncbi:MAG: 2-iminobutanoate/2-iminopropanoate deaminase [Thermoleophilaceae bacterium]|nr:2-iminobutanoate/2-iminopropanoate deaminase [Thermoleophilaceae bacterium]